jgi:hypothetical protein
MPDDLESSDMLSNPPTLDAGIEFAAMKSNTHPRHSTAYFSAFHFPFFLLF